MWYYNFSTLDQNNFSESAIIEDNNAGLPANLKTFTCSDCGKVYAVYRSLWRHRKFECINSMPKVSCDLCPYKSPHKWCIENHRRKYHSTESNAKDEKSQTS